MDKCDYSKESITIVFEQHLIAFKIVYLCTELNYIEDCYRDNLHSICANQELYIKGNSREQFHNILDKNMRPVYDSAKRQGYDVWAIGL